MPIEEAAARHKTLHVPYQKPLEGYLKEYPINYSKTEAIIM